jgi:hypothetical protein
MEKEWNWGTLLVHNTCGVGKHARTLGWNYEEFTSKSSI